jgi:aryl-alcohol dehydrogenase-like predicted oxidoreductase
MEYREFGNTGIKVSALGFGCGDVGGLIVRGTVQERLESVQRALDLGITYFDTASRYGITGIESGPYRRNKGAFRPKTYQRYQV